MVLTTWTTLRSQRIHTHDFDYGDIDSNFDGLSLTVKERSDGKKWSYPIAIILKFEKKTGFYYSLPKCPCPENEKFD